MKYCKKCVYPVNAVALEVADDGICSSCLSFKISEDLSDEFWDTRKNKLGEIFDDSLKKGSTNYDCLIPVSGGKDSYYQTHIIAKEYGLKPLLMTYHGNNFLPEGDYNRDQMRHNFDADHIVWGPSVEVLKKLNRATFKIMGDMNWQNHCGIMSAPIKVAVNFNIPLIIWGEIYMDYAGMHDPDDFVEFSARSRLEHDLRGYEWFDVMEQSKESFSKKDFNWASYPTDEEIIKVGVRGLYIGNYFKWDSNNHTKLMQEKYLWKTAEKPFERTYRNMSNLDDRYENGIHDLMKFIKFGYGRGSDHASKDIRSNYMTRSEGIEMVRKYDHVVSSDLYHWLDYVNMKEDEFWEIADTFRDPKVWWISEGKWWKNNIWGGASDFGRVNLSEEQINSFNKRQQLLGI
jgi:N-acetyl sugar amidotransferase